MGRGGATPGKKRKGPWSGSPPGKEPGVSRGAGAHPGKNQGSGGGGESLPGMGREAPKGKRKSQGMSSFVVGPNGSENFHESGLELVFGSTS